MIWRALLGVFSNLLLSVTALAASWFGGRKSAQTDAKLEEAEDAIQGHVLRNEVENRIARDRDAKQRLRDKWSE
jgi:hypothetical protein